MFVGLLRWQGRDIEDWPDQWWSTKIGALSKGSRTGKQKEAGRVDKEQLCPAKERELTFAEHILYAGHSRLLFHSILPKALFGRDRYLRLPAGEEEAQSRPDISLQTSEGLMWTLRPPSTQDTDCCLRVCIPVLQKQAQFITVCNIIVTRDPVHSIASCFGQ